MKVACFYCLGVSSVGLDEAAYTRICYDFPVAAATTLSKINAEMTFVYVSGAGTDPAGRAMWKRVKGRTERAVLDTFRNGYAFRPGIIQPTFGATSKTSLYRAVYAVATPLFPVLERLAPKHVTTTDRVGRAMLQAARYGFDTHIVENADLR